VKISNYSPSKARPANPARDVEPLRAVLTLAIGKPIYFEMAVNLARSFLWWHDNSDIRFFLATDQTMELPPDLSDIKTIRLNPGQFGTGFSPKLYLDKIAPAEKTLFIDADCLCVGALDTVFDRFAEFDVSVIGEQRNNGEHFGDIGERCRQNRIDWVPMFVGGLYYVRRGDVAKKVFAKARELEKSYDELGLVRLRGVPNEEPLLGLAMGIYDQKPIPDDGSIKAEPMFFYDTPEVDVFHGRARLTGGGRRPSKCWTARTLLTANPVIVHFNASFAEQPPYTSEAVRLKKVLRYRWPIFIASIYAGVTVRLPYTVAFYLKNALRPVYRALFGFRRLAPSPRS
jgi:hypothetical protein